MEFSTFRACYAKCRSVFLLLGAVLVLAMHAGFAFLELGTVRHKNQVNALSKILTDFALSAIAYFFVGYYISYGQHFFHDGTVLSNDHGYNLMRCFFYSLLLRPFLPSFLAVLQNAQNAFTSDCHTRIGCAGLSVLRGNGLEWQLRSAKVVRNNFWRSFHDFAGSVVVHAMGGWIALAAVILLGARSGRYKKDGRVSAHPPSSIPFWRLVHGF